MKPKLFREEEGVDYNPLKVLMRFSDDGIIQRAKELWSECCKLCQSEKLRFIDIFGGDEIFQLARDDRSWSDLPKYVRGYFIQKSLDELFDIR